jgi:hypothetical protein
MLCREPGKRFSLAQIKQHGAVKSLFATTTSETTSTLSVEVKKQHDVKVQDDAQLLRELAALNPPSRNHNAQLYAALFHARADRDVNYQGKVSSLSISSLSISSLPPTAVSTQ